LKANSPRKITHFWLVYDIADCRSGPVRQPFFASVFKTPASPHGAFSRMIPKTDGQANQVQLRLKGRFMSTTKASGSFRVGVIGKCPITASTHALSFTATLGDRSEVWTFRWAGFEPATSRVKNEEPADPEAENEP
jgi:hypothetical protein